jgi:hypothetical protein
MNKNLKKFIEEIIVEEAESTSEIKKVQIMALNRWDDFPSVADISLAGSQGIGPGEHRLAKIFGGEVQGQSQSFDLLVPSGSDFAGQWEVKAPDGAGTIRPGTDGLRAYAPLNKALKAALDELQEFLETDNIEASVDADILDQIRTFIEDHGDKIVRGEVTKNRFDEVQRIFELVGEMIKSMSGDAVKKVSIGDKQYDVTPTTLVKISRLLGTSEEDMRAELGDSMGSAVVLSALNSPAFLNIQDLVDLWEGSIQPEEVFDLDGIILVNRQGFMLIPKGQYQGNVTFNRVTQSKPRFKVPMKGEGKMDESLVREFIREAFSQKLSQRQTNAPLKSWHARKSIRSGRIT